MENLLHDHPIADGAGKVTFFMGLLMNVWNWISSDDINQIFVILTSIGGLIYIYIKIRIAILEWKEKKSKYNK